MGPRPDGSRSCSHSRKVSKRTTGMPIRRMKISTGNGVPQSRTNSHSPAAATFSISVPASWRISTIPYPCAIGIIAII